MSQPEVARPAAEPLTALTFQLGDETYAVAVDGVTEITTLFRITPVPGCNPWVRGLINLRGRVVPVLDVRSRLGLPERPYDASTCILIVEHDAVSAGLVVDQVFDVTELDRQLLEQPPDARQARAACIEGIHRGQDQIRILLDLAALLEPT
jgi:purine-binding chemotaxis protein CheW